MAFHASLNININDGQCSACFTGLFCRSYGSSAASIYAFPLGQHFLQRRRLFANITDMMSCEKNAILVCIEASTWLTQSTLALSQGTYVRCEGLRRGWFYEYRNNFVARTKRHFIKEWFVSLGGVFAGAFVRPSKSTIIVPNRGAIKILVSGLAFRQIAGAFATYQRVRGRGVVREGKRATRRCDGFDVLVKYEARF